MKNLYKTPEITVEVLAKYDVLCNSDIAPDAYDNGQFSLFDSILEDIG